MKSYRCTICGEISLSESVPANCPFCGVAERYIFISDKVDGDGIFKNRSLSEESRMNLIQALNMETHNASFYKCASEKSESEEVRALFKRLAKNEREHADIIRKHLELDSIDFLEEECSIDDIENIEQAIIATKETMSFYKGASIDSKESKISILFNALAEVEEGYLKVLVQAKK
ncbi:MAG TPA: ferritin family protein [Patescibacteria group bacterium]|nr:ferritin family protein [Patescibacteria group bacterium]